jgi:hypothetical protein
MEFVPKVFIALVALTLVVALGSWLAGPAPQEKPQAEKHVVSGQSSASGAPKVNDQTGTHEPPANASRGSRVVVVIATSGGAGYAANLNASGASAENIDPQYADERVVMRADTEPELAMTVTRVTEAGTVHVKVFVDGELVAKNTATSANTSVNIVGTPPDLTAA